MPNPVSKAQGRFFGAIAGGQIKVPGLSPSEARTRLRGVRLASLPERKGGGSSEKTRQIRIAALRRSRNRRKKRNGQTNL